MFCRRSPRAPSQSVNLCRKCYHITRPENLCLTILTSQPELLPVLEEQTINKTTVGQKNGIIQQDKCRVSQTDKLPEKGQLCIWLTILMPVQHLLLLTLAGILFIFVIQLIAGYTVTRPRTNTTLITCFITFCKQKYMRE